MNQPQPLFDPNAPLDALGNKIYEAYREELRLISNDDAALLITHMHLATLRLTELVKKYEAAKVVRDAINSNFKGN